MRRQPPDKALSIARRGLPVSKLFGLVLLATLSLHALSAEAVVISRKGSGDTAVSACSAAKAEVQKFALRYDGYVRREVTGYGFCECSEERGRFVCSVEAEVKETKLKD